MYKKASLSIELSGFSIFTVFANFLFDQKMVTSGTKFEEISWAVGIMTKPSSVEKALALDEVRFCSVLFRCRCVFTNDSTKKFQHLKNEVTFRLIGVPFAAHNLTFRNVFSKHAFGKLGTP